MLVFPRKKNESIVAGPSEGGERIEVTVVEIRGDKVRLGITAPKEWLVHRREVYEAVYGKPPDEPPRPANP